MKAAELKEDRLRVHYIKQLNKLGFYDTEGKSLFQLTSTLSRIRRIEQFHEINRDSAENVWFE